MICRAEARRELVDQVIAKAQEQHLIQNYRKQALERPGMRIISARGRMSLYLLEQGRSLERLSERLAMDDPRNWHDADPT